MKTQAIYTNISDTVMLVCEQCGRTKALPAAVVKDLPQPLKVRCPCGETFGVTIAIRKFYRKKTRLSGTYVKRDVKTNKIVEQGRMVVEDISRTGIGIRTMYKHAIGVNDVLLITFALDDKQKTAIQKSVRVRRVGECIIGAEFTDHDAYTEENRALGFYLLPR